MCRLWFFVVKLACKLAFHVVQISIVFLKVDILYYILYFNVLYVHICFFSFTVNVNQSEFFKVAYLTELPQSHCEDKCKKLSCGTMSG